jgi:hypothetical protein
LTTLPSPGGYTTPSLLRKIFVHVRGLIQARVTEEKATNWVKVPYRILEHYRAMSYAVVQTDDVPDQVKMFVHNYSQGLEQVTKNALRQQYGDAVFPIASGISQESFAAFYQNLASWTQQQQIQHLKEWDGDQTEWDGELGDTPDGK